MSSKKESNPKPKRVQVKYQRYDHEFTTFTTVKSKEGGGTRFIEVQGDKPVTFKDIKRKAIDLYFDKDENNFFMENRYQCTFDFMNIAEEKLGDEDLWKYLKDKGMSLSRSVFILQSNFDADDEELPHVLKPNSSYFEQNNERLNIGFDLSTEPSSDSFKRKLCQVCHCTYEGDYCIICQQNLEFSESLIKDSSTDQVLESPPRPTAEELREIRVNNIAAASKSTMETK